MSETVAVCAKKALNSQQCDYEIKEHILAGKQCSGEELELKSTSDHQNTDMKSECLMTNARIEVNNQQARTPLSKDLAVCVRNASKHYGNKADVSIVLDGLNMTVPKGAIYGLLGASGCGKTTLLNCIAGRKKLDSGEVWVLDGTPKSKTCSIPGPRMGYAPQDTSLYGEFTIRETLMFFGWVAGMTSKDIDKKLEFFVQLLSLPAANQQVKNLSGGQQRRVSLASALLHEPQLLILDEPTVGLDPVVRQNIWDHFLNITSSGNTTIIITTHYIEETRQAHIIALMRGGYFLAEESPESLLSRNGCATLQDVYHKLSVLQNSCGCVDNIEKLNNNTLINNPISKGSEFGSKIFNKNHMKALIWKSFTWMIRNYSVLMLMLLMPVIQNFLFCTCIGGDPKNLPIAVVNYDMDNITNCENDLICNNSSLSCSYLKYLERRTFIMIPYDSEEDARQSVLKGKTYASIVFRQNYSSAMHKRIKDWEGSEPWDIAASEIDIFRDVSNKLVANFLKVLFYDTFNYLVRDYMEACNMNARWLMLPIKWEPPVYGVNNPKYTDFIAPGLLVSFTWFSSMTLTSLIIKVEQGEGILERFLVIGISTIELMSAHFLCLAVIMTMQTMITLVCFFAILDITLNGSLALVTILTLMTGISGMSYGLCLSCICGSIRTTFYAAIGSFLTFFLLGGIFWPVEGMHSVLQQFVRFFPLTQVTESFRSIMQRSWDISAVNVYLGFMSVTMWTIIFLIVALVLLKFKKN